MRAMTLLLLFQASGWEYQLQESVINVCFGDVVERTRQIKEGVHWDREKKEKQGGGLDTEQRALYRLICQLIYVLCSVPSPPALR